MKKLFIPFFCFCLSLILSCRSDEPSQQKTLYPVKLRANKNNKSSFYINISSKAKSEMVVRGEEVQNENEANVGLHFNTLNDSSGNVLIDVIYDKIKVTINKNGDIQVFDANQDKQLSGPVDKILHGLIGAKLNVTINKNKQVVKVEGSENINSNILSSLTDIDPGNKKAIIEQMSKLVGEDFINDLFQQNNSMPDTAIKVGARWSKTSIEKKGFPVKVKTNFKLVSIKNNLAKIELNSKIESDKSNTNNIMMPNNGSADISGEQKGFFLLDTLTGIIINSEIKGNMIGEVVIMNEKFPIKISTERYLETKNNPIY